jgi:hypothetical protein
LIISAICSIAEAQQFSEAIEDNSFFIEEAYNQEERVVQHISNSVYTMNPNHEFSFTFTQEWPVTTETHQLSYTLSFITLNSNLSHGIGDIVINYRYQLCTKASWAAISPRMSLILPTGDSDKGLGNGVLGFQADIPASKRITDQFILHANAGGTILPAVKGTTIAGEKVERTLVKFFLGLSGIWLAERYDNFLLECLYTNESNIDTKGEIQREHVLLLNPAYRHAIEIGGLEVVPGIGFPVTITKASTDVGIFFYLSFEHPY